MLLFGVVRHPDLVLGQQRDLLVRHPHAVRGEHGRAPEPDLLEVFDRATLWNRSRDVLTSSSVSAR